MTKSKLARHILLWILFLPYGVTFSILPAKGGTPHHTLHTPWDYHNRHHDPIPSFRCQYSSLTKMKRGEEAVADCNDDDEEDGEEEGDISMDSDWIRAELTLLYAPNIPHPDLNADTVATIICRSLQWVDYPTSLEGLKRCYHFFTDLGKELVTQQQGKKSLEGFLKIGVFSPALQPFMGARRVDLGSATFTPAHPPLRGAIVSYPVIIESAPILSVHHPSGMERNGVTSPPVIHMVLRLEQQRRPPYQGCWMVRELLDVRFAFAGDMGNVHVGG